MNNLSSKEKLRLHFKQVRAQLPLSRRHEAERSLLLYLLPILIQFDYILSFASFGSEIQTWSFNLHLSYSKALLLPKMHKNKLHIFSVVDPSTQLIRNSFGILEPNPLKCKKIAQELIQVALIPGLGFDQFNNRLGYGRGYYDLFLNQIPHAKTIGIGFKEQFITNLPIESHDRSLEKVSLF